MLDNEELDLVYVATPWEYHYPQARAALLAGAHVGVELPIATELAELWDLVDTSERTRRHLWLMENCSYGRNELAMLKMAHDGVFGDVTSGHGGYLHDLRALLFVDGVLHEVRGDGCGTPGAPRSFYPMHGLAPIAAAMDVNRGDRMLTLSATVDGAAGAGRLPRAVRAPRPPGVVGDLRQRRPGDLHDQRPPRAASSGRSTT